mmetsp:Transcript_8648/g.19552  ORF Transcript_8648/g.19552 Transcript_8648/m.19552 type:complete len:240 (-) Transcript_8648:3377-4096(-)
MRGVCKASTLDKRLSCIRCAGVASRRSYARCTGSARPLHAPTSASATSPVSNSSSPCVSTAASGTPQIPAAMSSKRRATCTTGKATSDGNNFTPNARTAMHASRKHVVALGARSAACNKSLSHKSHTISPSGSWYCEKCTISRQMSHSSHGLAKSLYKSLSCFNSRSNSYTNASSGAFREPAARAWRERSTHTPSTRRCMSSSLILLSTFSEKDMSRPLLPPSTDFLACMSARSNNAMR